MAKKKNKLKKKNNSPPVAESKFKFIESSSPTVAYTAASGSAFCGTTAIALNASRAKYKPRRCYKLRTFLRRLLGCLFPACFGSRYKHTLRHQPAQQAGNANDRRRRGRFKAICCPPWNCFPFCCCAPRTAGGRHRTVGSGSSDDLCHLIRNCGSTTDHQLDIDQYVAQYRQAEQRSQLPATSSSGAAAEAAAGATGSGTRTPSVSQSTTPEVHKKRDPKKKKLIKHIWNWNDSLKSNSDKFLESLEYDAVHGGGGGGSGGGSKSNSLKKYRKIANCSNIDEEELATSPDRADTPTKDVGVSPTRSHTGSSKHEWNASSQSPSDDDIDRLVAMHRHRNSLSSLGVRSDSMASVYSGAGENRYGTVAVKGNIEFGMQYNYKQGTLEVTVVQCKDLAAVDTKRNRSDPYVKLYLLPDKSKGGKRKTKVKKHTLNPFFDETLKFQISLSALESRTLWLTVWHSDMFGRNDFLGEVSIGLQGKVFDNPQPQWYMLQERSEPFDESPVYKGEIIVALKYVPPEAANGAGGGAGGGGTGSGGNGTLNLRKFSKSSLSTKNATRGELHILIKEAKNLTAIKPSGNCDAFCKSYLLPDKNRTSKRKTEIAKRTVNPTWCHTIIYEDVSLQELSDRALELTVWDHDRLASNEFLGGVRFSLGTGKSNGKSVDWMDATGKELSLWQSMLNRPNFWVEGCVVLRSSLEGARPVA